MTKKPKNQFAELAIYQAKDGAIEFKLDKENETLIAKINQVAELFGVQKAAISKHLNNIFKEGELKKASTVSIMETVQIEGKRKVERKIEFYNLDAIIAVGYRVNSKQATNFRIWATKVLKSYLLDGYVVNKKQIAPMYFEGNTDTEIFNQWVEEFPILMLQPEQVVIMDNAAFHKSQKTKELI